MKSYIIVQAVNDYHKEEEEEEEPIKHRTDKLSMVNHCP
jgi:hypothetical protein